MVAGLQVASWYTKNVPTSFELLANNVCFCYNYILLPEPSKDMRSNIAILRDTFG
jgi:hypothetical protein